MLRNYLKIALRNLRKHAGYTFINVAGLALGVACCLLIMLLVRHEWSYDTHHEKGDRIFRILMQHEMPDGSHEHWLLTPPPLAQAIDSAFTGVERTTRLIGGQKLLRYGEASFPESVYMVDSTFFEIFSFPLLAGSARSVLADPQGMVITEAAALKYFGAGRSTLERAIGRNLTVLQGEDAIDFRVTGVLEDLPHTSSFRADVFISMQSYYLEGGSIYLGGNRWGSKNTLYALLAPGQDAEALEVAMPPLTRVELGPLIEARREAGYLADAGEGIRLVLQPLRDIHLNPRIGNAYEAGAHNPTYSYVLAGIGLLVLLIACINFVTLSLARSTTRAREVGMRKVLGAHRIQLMKQFWGEALLLSLVALVFGLVLAGLVLPEFNALTGRELSLLSSGGWSSIMLLVVLIGTVALVSGAYPAVVLSGFRPASVLKGEHAVRKVRFSRGLVVAQYAISVGLIFCTIVMYRQLDYLLNKDIGFEDDQVVVVDAGGLSEREDDLAVEAFRSGTASYPNVSHVLRTGYAFTKSYDEYSWTAPDGRTIRAHMLGIDFDFLDVMKMRLVDGRDFSRAFPSDSASSVLVNQAFVRTYGIEQPLGYRLEGFGSFFGETAPTIIGVVHDFNFRSLHEEVEPAVLNMHPDYYMGMNHILVKIRPDAVRETLGLLQELWTSILPDKPFRYTFLDEDIAAQYQAERRWGRMLTYSSVLAILIASMGLFGLATLSAARRRKEIGIRKVLGATVSGIAALVTREFAVLVCVSAVVAWPIAFFGMREWMGSFAYRTSIPWWVFTAAALAALGIAVGTVSFHAWRAATADPARSLRYE